MQEARWKQGRLQKQEDQIVDTIHYGLLAWAILATVFWIYAAMHCIAYRKLAQVWQRHAAELLEMLNSLFSAHAAGDGAGRQWMADRTRAPRSTTDGQPQLSHPPR